MPLVVFNQIFSEGLGSIPYATTALKIALCLGALTILKIFFGGARNTADRNMHSKVVMMTGATSGIGAAIAKDLAARGAQLVILTQHPLNDLFLIDFIEDLRDSTHNELITAEQVDLSSLHSIRKFATKWVDNAPPRRLDMLILCANTMVPKGGKVVVTEEGVESTFGINYLANFHLLSILSPALRAQPPDRDVRILFGICNSYVGGRIPTTIPRPKISDSSSNNLIAQNPSLAYGSSQLALLTFAHAFQSHLSAYVRPDKNPNNARVYMCDPGWSRTPGMRRYLTSGTIFGLTIYLLTWPLWWLILKSPDQGMQSFLSAAMEAEFERGPGGQMIREVKVIEESRKEPKDTEVQKKLWQMSEKAIELLEREGAEKRTREKKSKEGEKVQEEHAKERERKEGSRKSRKKADKT